MADAIAEPTADNSVELTPIAPSLLPLAGGIPKHVLEVADSCFEVFTSKELRQKEVVLSELVSAYPDLSKSELSQAIDLALNWKRQIPRASRSAH